MGSIKDMMSGAINTKMFEPYKNMRVIFQIRQITSNLPKGVLNVELGADWQVKPCDAKI